MLTKLGDNPMRIFKLMDRIQYVLMHQNSLIAISIREAYNQRVPYRQILATIKSQMGDNVNIGKEIFGEELLSEIMNFK